MLVLARQLNQSVKIGEDITVTVVRISDGSVRLGISAPKALNIVREELGPVRPIQATESDVADLGRRVIDPLGVAAAYEEAK